MKILHVIFSFHTGGAENLLVDILNEQVKSQNVALFVINDEYNLAGVLFLKDIKKTINKYGAKKISKAKLHLYYILFRIYGGRIKRFLHLQ